MQGDQSIFWIGIAAGGFGVYWSLLKATVVWHSCHSLQDGMVPTLDFPVVCPVWIAGFAWCLLQYYGRYPFEWFALLVYLAVAVGYALVSVAFERHGKPVRDRKYQQLLASNERPAGSAD